MLACLAIASVTPRKPFANLADTVQSIGISEQRGRRGHIRLETMRHRVHTSMRTQLSRHRIGKFVIDDSNVGGDVEVRERILDTVLVVGDNRKRCYLRSRTRRGGNRAEVRLLTQLGKAERLNDIVERRIRILVDDASGYS